jgi:hypothetical protein
MAVGMIPGGTSPASASQTADSAVKPWSAALQMRYHLNSHTSFEFGNPFPPNQAPLSRLEFPMNTQWVGVEIRRDFPRLSLGVEAFTNIVGDARGLFKDSDWDDDASPDVKTIYSESKCRMASSYDVRADLDMKISDWVGLPDWFDIRPLIGFRFQQFTLIAHDGTQSYPAPGDTRPSLALPGDGIHFQQQYWHYFLGVRMAYELGRHIKGASRVKLFTQMDWAYVDGNNEDRHLLRIGNRITYENTWGDAWHALLGLKIDMTKSFSANLAADYLNVRTKGSHRLVNNAFDLDYRFGNGVKVWSEQISITMNLEYRF